MVDGKDELAMDQLGAVTDGANAGAYSLSQYGVEQTRVTANATLRAEASEFDPKRRSRLIQFENEKL
jgi:hypothetical protein